MQIAPILLLLPLALGWLVSPLALAGTPPATAQCEMPSLAGMLQDVLPGVVSINFPDNKSADDPLLSDPFFRRFFGLPEQPQLGEFQVGGSGVVVDAAKGYVITSNHLIESAEELNVDLSDGRRMKARKIGTDPATDIAVLQIPAEELTAVRFGDSDLLKVGDYVVAIGSPFGLDQTVTSGIVSGLGRTGAGINAYESFIQTDAAVNPGSSGGALVNLRGELVGINTAIMSPSGNHVGIGFAVPSDMARKVTDQLIAYGKIKRGQLGMRFQELTPELANKHKITVRGGALVQRVIPKSPADEAGIAPGDVITAINGERVRSSIDLRNKIALLRVGSPVQLDVTRDGIRKQVATHIAEATAETVQIASKGTLAGLRLGSIEPDSPLYERTDGAVIVDVQPGSKAARAGLRSGDIIVGVGREAVASPAEVAKKANATKGKVQLQVLRDGSALSITIG
ncbi:MAG TPA: Do family serine endopeptidase [Hyphomicrobiales bacterium]